MIDRASGAISHCWRPLQRMKEGVKQALYDTEDRGEVCDRIMRVLRGMAHLLQIAGRIAVKVKWSYSEQPMTQRAARRQSDTEQYRRKVGAAGACG
jgi:Holliday junction resolvase RusA-like endonuclease